MKFKIKFDNEWGDTLCKIVQASTLDDAIEILKREEACEHVHYHMEYSERPAENSTILEWAHYLLPGPHLSRFIQNVISQKESGWLDRELTQLTKNTTDHAILNKIIDYGFTWGRTIEAQAYGSTGTDYWSALAESDFHTADVLIGKFTKSKVQTV